LVFVIFAAAKDAIATGGVNIDNTLKYNTNIWAHISVNPASIRDGAVMIATITYAAPVGIPIPKIIHKTEVNSNNIIEFPLAS
jgi:hypothetical protein